MISSIYRTLVVKPAVKRQKTVVERIKARGKARVAIIVSSLSMWRLEAVYEIMNADRARFDARIFLIPFAKQCDEEKAQEMEKLRTYFNGKGIPFFPEGEFVTFDPDIVFYQQFYKHSYAGDIQACRNEHRLLCYSPYGMMFIDRRWQYNSRFHNRAWKIFLQSEEHRKVAEKLAWNRAANVSVVGDADSDVFMDPRCEDVWKSQDKPKKKVIWAPHHKKLGRDSFEWTAAEMKDAAIRYADKLQFAFKPHPRLKTELYKDPSWGQERTDEFYRFWADSPDTQLETGAFAQLFKGSDAMIHDCNSFIAEYLYTRRPVLFLSTNTASIRKTFGRFGRAALDAHYHGADAAAISSFLDDVVLGGKDPLEQSRETFYEEYLRPKGECFSRAVVDDIIRSIWG